MGDDPGSREISEEFGLIFCPEVECSSQGVPKMDDMFRRASSLSSNPVLAAISSDILVFQDTMPAIERLTKQFPLFMASVHRHDSGQIDYLIDFSDSRWEQKVKQGIALGHPGCGDYFLFPKSYFRTGIPPFVWGRASCDNWLIGEAISRGTCVDVTPCVTIVHPNHDHSHIPGDMDGMLASEDFRNNRQLAGDKVGFEIRHSNWVMEPDRIRKR